MKILVYSDWSSPEPATLMGFLSVEHIKGKEVFSFNYDPEWLKKRFAFSLDPDLALFEGNQYLSEGKKNFGIFLDSAPDRWGRVLMDRREAALARTEKRKAKTLFEEDYLLGVFDKHRIGAIRFKLSQDGPFQNDNVAFASPPWAYLRELENASLQLESDSLSDAESIKWLTILLAPGASLGGARPKASVTGLDNHLWIAKFPSVKDDLDISGWEMVENELAKLAGLTVAEGIIKKFNSRYHTYLSKRFDRKENEARIHFASAMTLIGANDGEPGHSYLEIAEFISTQGARVSSDLEELWRRIIFNVLTKNTDDHLRNHGFLLTDRGWELAPAYDLNPNYQGKSLSLNIDETDNTLDIDIALSVAKYFRIKEKKAIEICKEIKAAVTQWKTFANKHKLAKSEQELMSRAFEE